MQRCNSSRLADKWLIGSTIDNGIFILLHPVNHGSADMDVYMEGHNKNVVKPLKIACLK